MNKFIHDSTEEYKVRVVLVNYSSKFSETIALRIGFFGSRTDTNTRLNNGGRLYYQYYSRVAVAVVAAALHTQRIHQSNK